MKKIIILAFALHAIGFLQAQSSSDSLVVKPNSLTVNVNSLLEHFFSGGNSTESILTYRRTFKTASWRFGIGGFANRGDHFANDSNYNYQQAVSVNLRTGMDFGLVRYKRWTAYLGFDLLAGMYDYHSEEPQGGAERVYDSYTWSFGCAPLAGVFFQLNPMIAFGAETAYDVTYELGNQTTRYNYSSGTYWISDRQYRSFATEYYYPVKLNVRVNF